MRILNVKDTAVTRGVLDKSVDVCHDLVEVTYVDDSNTPHTVFAHKEGPFDTPESIVEAHRNGTLHLDPNEVEPPAEPVPPQGEAKE